MSLPTKAIFAALVLSLTPVVASAQSGFHLDLGQIGLPHQIITPAPGIGAPTPGIVGTPVQARDCGAQQLQHLVGLSVAQVQASGLGARYFTPHSPYGTMDYLPHRLNISADANFIIDRVYCG